MFSFSYLKEIFYRYERKLSSIALVLGFIFDNLTLQRVDFVMDNLIIIFYLALAGLSIVLMNAYEDGRLKGWFIENFNEFLPIVLQFSFGGLFSAFVIFYSRSATLFSSGPFVLILAVLLIGNEFLRKKYAKLVFQTTLYFLSIFSFMIFFIPVLTKEIGATVFLLSGALSLLTINIFILIISRFASKRFFEKKKSILFSIYSVFIFINILYFLNIIPPIPLSLKEADVYYLVTKTQNGSYFLQGEEYNHWYEKYLPVKTIHLSKGSPAYVFSSVFAPTDLNTQITHDWQYYDESLESWISSSKITFPIIGGRDAGFRGFSKKEIIWGGKWRVDIKTTRGQIVGRVRFNIEETPSNFNLRTRSL
jgi:hypothetical protein